ncbi:MULTISPECIES: hypothetical protein [Paraburkholderia]|uniref:Nmad3 family putative nucleotide modification protein n=1 Tax=Paraburkholderia TaxID=1822464 RepID=UPI002251E9C3|nr:MULTISPECIES: hypothetical protein [Paraburkholderia]MCX4170809.1 hypothetical protein [Paraburkholderia madseniana]MDQ6458821.1 hypothetical protein [Paraburkholderia madseniana]
MSVVLLRVGIDSGSGGMQGPLFADGSFELVPIPDSLGVGRRTYGNTAGRNGVPLVEYFPHARRALLSDQAMHVDPEFETFTYGDPTRPKAGLARLEQGDILAFYAGLEGWLHDVPAGLYLVGYFVVEWAGLATSASQGFVSEQFAKNFHVMHEKVYVAQRQRLVLVKGCTGSRLLEKAHLISAMATNRAGQPLKVLSPEAQAVFGDFGGHISIQRSPPRWVDEKCADRAKAFLNSLL